MTASPPTLEERVARVEEVLGIKYAAPPADPVDELVESLARQAAAHDVLVPDPAVQHTTRLVPVGSITFQRGALGPVLIVRTHADIEDPAERLKAVTAELESRRDELTGYLTWQPPQVVA